MINLFDFIIHVDKYVGFFIQNYGVLSYFILFLIIFIETGLVIMPFLPGDSLLFVVGTFASQGVINIFALWIILFAAAVLGDSLNYFIGNYFGKRVFEKSVLFKKEYLKKTEEFYEKHGGKTIIYARFIPMVRTFAPFVAGVSKMRYSKFILYNVLGGFMWVTLFLFAGYYFGGIPLIEKNLNLVILLIIVISIIPPIIEYFKINKKRKNDLKLKE